MMAAKGWTSLHFRWRGVVARAVAGDLRAGEEERLRVHLRACDSCRDHYDRSSTVAAGLAGAWARVSPTPAIAPPPEPETAEAVLHEAVGASAIAARRERERLMRALGAGAQRQTIATQQSAWSRGRRWRLAAIVLAPVTALIVARVTYRGAAPPSQPSDANGEITWRGSDETKTASSTPSLLVYASLKENGSGAERGPVRLAADFPKSGEAQVARDEYVQFAVRGLPTPAYTVVVGIDARGGFHQYLPRPGADPEKLVPSPVARALGVSIDLAAGHPPGRLLVFAIFSSDPPDLAGIRAAATRLDRAAPNLPRLDVPALQVAGVLLVAP